MPGEKWVVVGLLCFFLFYAFVVPRLPGDKGNAPDGLFVAMWVLWLAIFILTFLSWRKRKDASFCWDDVACWLEQNGNQTWKLNWRDYSHYQEKGTFLRQLILVDKNGEAFAFGVQGPEGNRSIEYRVRKILRIMAFEQAQLPQPKFRKKMPKWQVVAYGIGCLVAGAVGIQQLISFQVNISSENPQPVSPIQVLTITVTVLLFALWFVLFLSGLGSQSAKSVDAPVEPMPKWSLDNYLTFGAAPASGNEIRFSVSSEKSAKLGIRLEKGIVWFVSLAMAGIGAIGCFVGFKQMRTPMPNEMSATACFLTAVPFFALSGFLALLAVKSRGAVRRFDDVLAFEGEKLFVLRDTRKIAVENWNGGIRRVRGVLEIEVEGQKTLYDLLGWGQEVGKGNGE